MRVCVFCVGVVLCSSVCFTLSMTSCILLIPFTLSVCVRACVRLYVCVSLSFTMCVCPFPSAPRYQRSLLTDPRSLAEHHISPSSFHENADISRRDCRYTIRKACYRENLGGNWAKDDSLSRHTGGQLARQMEGYKRAHGRISTQADERTWTFSFSGINAMRSTLLQQQPFIASPRYTDRRCTWMKYTNHQR